MIPVIVALVFAGAGITGLSVIGYMVGPHWRRIIDTACGFPTPPPQDRWRNVHLAADRRPPLHQFRGAPRRRGLFGGRAR